MKNYDEMFQKVLARREEYEKKKKKRTVIIKRTAAAVFGTAAVLGIGLTTYVLRPPKKPTPNQSDIIAETETTSAETTTAPTSSSTAAPRTTTAAQTTAATTAVTTASARQTVTSVRTTTSGSHMNVVLTTKIAVTLAVTNSTAASTSTVVVPLTTTTVSPVSTSAATTTRPVSPNNNYTYIYEQSSDSVLVKTGADASESQLGDKMKGCEVYNGKTVTGTKLSAEFYELIGVSSDAVVAVRLGESESCSVYLNTAYEPKTLGEMFDDMGLNEEMSFGAQNIRVPSEKAYYDVSADRIMSVLNDCRDAVNTHESISTISRDMIIFPEISYMRYSTSFYISEQGYITTNIIDHGASFYIGEDKAQRCIEYLLEK